MEKIKKRTEEEQRMIDGLTMIIEGYALFYDWPIEELLDALSAMKKEKKINNQTKQ